MSAGRPLSSLSLGQSISVVTVMRDGVLRDPESVGALSPGDHVVLVASADALPALDRRFGRPPKPDRRGRDQEAFGEFAFPGDVELGKLAKMYDIPIPLASQQLTADAFLRKYIKGPPLIGDRLRLGTVEVVVREVADDHITQIGLELDPQPLRFLRWDLVRIWVRDLGQRLSTRSKREGED